MSETRKPRLSGDSDLIARVRAAARQEQFLEVVSAEEARSRFEKHLELKPFAAETVKLADSRGRVLANDVIAAVDAPPFDRSDVDGFAVRAVDTSGASDGNPKVLTLNPEVIACGHMPIETVAAGTCTAIATGGVIPRGADAVVMIEQTDLIEEGKPRLEMRRAVLPGQFISFAGSDIARGETLLRRGTEIGAREIGMLAACGLDRIEVVRRPKVAVLSTGDRRCRGRGSGWRADRIRRVSRRCGGARKSRARGTRRKRHGGAVRRHVERRGRPVAPRGLAARQAGNSGARRGAQAGQALVPGCRR
jgi:flagellar basal body rod protein FlgB